jgi:hypothetical protein
VDLGMQGDFHRLTYGEIGRRIKAGNEIIRGSLLNFWTSTVNLSA